MRRQRIYTLHSWLGIIAAGPLLLIALTGSILVFTDEIDELLLGDGIVVGKPAQPRADMDRSLARLGELLPDHEVVGWARYPDPGRADLVYVIRHGSHEWLKLYFDSTRGEILTPPRKTGDYLTGWLLELHFALLLGHGGMFISGLLALVLCGLGITGIITYRKFWLRFLSLRWGKGLRPLMGNLHKRVGILSGPIFLVLGITGAYWNLTHVIGDFIQHGFTEEEIAVTTRLYSRSLSMHGLMIAAWHAMPDFETRYLSLPHEAGQPLTLYGSVPTRNFLRSGYGSFASFDARTGALLLASDIRSAGPWRQVEDMFVPLHFGNFGGLPVKILWCVLGFGPGLLAASGTLVWWRRRRSQPALVRNPVMEERCNA